MSVYLCMVRFFQNKRPTIILGNILVFFYLEQNQQNISQVVFEFKGTSKQAYVDQPESGVIRKA